MERNFQFDGPSLVRWGDRLFDLHNAYDLESFGTDLTGSEVKLTFTRNEHAIDPDKLPAIVTISCAGNVTVAFNDLCEVAAPLDDEGIEIAYFDEGCDWLSFLDEDIARSREPLGFHVSSSTASQSASFATRLRSPLTKALMSAMGRKRTSAPPVTEDRLAPRSCARPI